MQAFAKAQQKANQKPEQGINDSVNGYSYLISMESPSYLYLPQNLTLVFLFTCVSCRQTMSRIPLERTH